MDSVDTLERRERKGPEITEMIAKTTWYRIECDDKTEHSEAFENRETAFSSLQE